jgi:serine/threonine-protein kinase
VDTPFAGYHQFVADETAGGTWEGGVDTGEDEVSPSREAVLGEAAVRFGWLTREHLDQALAERRATEPAPRLAHVLVGRGWLDAERFVQLRMLLSDLRPDADGALRVGRYEILGILGHGGMARVFKGRDPDLQRDAAIKVPHPSMGVRWEREARAMARITHPNIAAVYEVGADGPLRYLAMELVDGPTLDKAWESWPLRRKLAALRQVAAAVAAAHAAGVVHRDLKPRNVLVSPAGEAKVVDFGLARVEGEVALTRTGTPMGSPYYMSPEQVRGEHPTPATDVWALGVILYEALTGDVPFPGSTAGEVYGRILSTEPVPPGRRASGVPRDLEMRALERDSSLRYPSAEAFGHDLQRWLDGVPIFAQRLPLGVRLLRRVRRNPWAWAAVAVAVLSLAAGAGSLLAVRDAVARRREADELTVRAAEAFVRDDRAAAARNVEAALRLVPDHPRARTWRAHLRLRQYQAARGLPEPVISRGAVSMLPAPPETPALRTLREGIEADLRDSPARAFVRGILALWSGRYDEALASFDGAGDEPALATGREIGLLRAQCLYGLARFREAEQLLVAEKTPPDSLALWGRLMVARALEEDLTGGDWTTCFERAVRAGMMLADAADAAGGRRMAARARVEWARSLANHGEDPEEQLAAAERLLAGLDDPDALVVRGDGLLTRAERLRDVGRLDPRDPAPLHEAIAAYGAAALARPDAPLALLRRGFAHGIRGGFLYARGRPHEEAFDRGERDIRRALSLAPRHVGALSTLAGFLRDRALKTRSVDPDDYRAALAATEEALRLQPGMAGNHLARGYALRDLGSVLDDGAAVPVLEAALESLGRAIELNPRLLDAYRVRAVVHDKIAQVRIRQGASGARELESALADLRAIHAFGPPQANVLRQEGAVLMRMAWRRLGDPDERYAQSLEVIRRAIELEPRHPDGHRYHGQALLWRGLWRQEEGRAVEARGDLREAIRQLDYCLEHWPDNPGAQGWRDMRASAQAALKGS